MTTPTMYRRTPTQDYAPLFSPEQVAAVRAARQRAQQLAQEQEPQRQVIEHTDRHGKPWRFSIDCTPYQRRLLENLLLSVRNFGNVATLTTGWYENPEGNAAFCSWVEAVFLSGLAQEQAPEADTFPPSVVKEILTTENTEAQADTSTVDDERPARYYWDNF